MDNIQKFISSSHNMTLEMFSEIQEKILYVLHLLYNELTLNMLYEVEQNKLLYLLYTYVSNLDWEYA
jgi:hypothetical protein